MKNRYELIRIYRSGGGYVAAIFDNLENIFQDLRFLGYSKKQVIYKLRHEYGIKVGRDYC